MKFVKDPNIDRLLKARCDFFRKRFILYAEANNLTHNEAMDRIVMIQTSLGCPEVTKEVDRYMPPHLHSSQVPELREEVAA